MLAEQRPVEACQPVLLFCSCVQLPASKVIIKGQLQKKGVGGFHKTECKTKRLQPVSVDVSLLTAAERDHRVNRFSSYSYCKL